MRILVVNTADVGGGAERVASGVVEGYRRAGHQVTFVVGHVGGEPGPELLQLPNEQRRNIVARGLQQLSSGLQGPGRQAVAALARMAEPARAIHLALGGEDRDFPGSTLLTQLARSADVVHLHNLHGRYLDLRVLPAVSRICPLVLTLHDLWPITGHCAQPVECGRWRQGCGACPDLHRHPSIHRDGSAANHRFKAAVWQSCRMHVTAPSMWVLDMARQSILAPDALAFSHVPHGVDTDVFHARQRPPRSRALRVVWDGTRSRSYRNLALAQETLSLLASRHPDMELSVLGPDAPQLPKEARVRLLGRQNPDGVAAALRGADVYLHLSTADASSLACLEALACGTAVVATSVGGITELLAGRQGATLVGVGDTAAAVASAVERAFLTNPPTEAVLSFADTVRNYLAVLSRAAGGTRAA